MNENLNEKLNLLLNEAIYDYMILSYETGIFDIDIKNPSTIYQALIIERFISHIHNDGNEKYYDMLVEEYSKKL